MKIVSRRVGTWLMMTLAGGTLLQAGCLRTLQQEMEVLLAADANPLLIPDSWLANTFGPGLIQFFN